MATTFNWIFLGTTTTFIDPTEGNTNMENANLLVGQTYGTAANPLYTRIRSATMFDNGGTAGSMDTNNNLVNDTFTTDLGAGTVTLTYDGTVIYNATVTYVNGTTATVTAVLVQDTAGNLFLAPELTANADTTVYEAAPIRSITLNSINTSTSLNYGPNRQVTGWDNGIIDGTNAADLIDGTFVEPIAGGSDKVDGGDGLGTAATGWNDDSIRAGAGADTVLAGLGNDTADGGTEADSIDGGGGNDSLLGGSGVFSDTLLGGLGNDTLLGGDGGDLIDGGADNDSLLGEAGNDTVLGGTGADTALGGDGDDSIDGGDGTDSLLGDAGADTILGGAGSDTIQGGTGNDRLDGGTEADSLDGGTGDDRLFGGAGSFNDTLIGGDGNDTLHGDAGADLLSGGPGMDYADYSASGAGVSVNLATGIGAGGDAAGDTLSGVDGIFGSAFADTLIGYDGSSTVPGDAYTNVFYGNAGNDLMDGAGGDDSLFGGADNDTILGGAGNDLLDGGIGTDSLMGGAGADTLLGGAGDDLLDGGDGTDSLSGGTGSDRFRGLGAGDVIDGSEDADTTDIDTLDLFGSGWTKANTNILFDPLNRENGTVQFLDANGNVIGTMTFTNIENLIPCFTPGTLIETDRGAVPVESLRPDLRILTRDSGYQVLRWIGRRDLGPADLAARPALRPVLIGRGALGPDMPLCDMRVSPQHRMLLTGPRAELIAGESEVLAAALHLTGLPGIRRDTEARAVSYIHLLFDRHEIVRSDGVWSESFQPGEQALAGLGLDQRQEVLNLFPELTGHPATAYPAARPTVRRHEAVAILAA